MTAMLTALHRSRDQIVPALQAAVQRLDPSSRLQASYHLGWCDADGKPTEGGGGKAVRPALALLSAEAAGATAEVGIPGAVGVELVHNFSLLHDDLMDGDLERRHRRTVWAIWGAPAAILAGDALLALAHEVVLESPSPGRRSGRRCCWPRPLGSSPAARSRTSRSSRGVTSRSMSAWTWPVARPVPCSRRAPRSVPSSPAHRRKSSRRSRRSAASSASPSSWSMTSWASGATRR